jgi:hypothetical protein
MALALAHAGSSPGPLHEQRTNETLHRMARPRVVRAARQRKERVVAAHLMPAERGPMPQRPILIAKIGGAFWVISRFHAGDLLSDEEAVRLAVMTGNKISTHSTLQEAARAMQALINVAP